MAFANKYTGDFDDRTATTYTLSIMEDAATSSTVEWAARPIQIQWGERGSDIYRPFLASRGTIRVFDDDSTVADDLLTANEDQYRAHLERGSSTVFYGPLVTDRVRQTTDKNKTVTEVEVIGGLGRLEGITFTNSAGNIFRGRASAKDIIAKCIDKLGLTDQINTLYTGCTWYEDSMGASENPLAVIDIEQGIFTDGDGNPISCKQVLEQVLQRFGLRLFQSEGAWWAVQRELLNGSFTRFEYHVTDGAAQGSSSFDPRQTISSADEFDDRIAGGRRRTRIPYKDTRVTYEHSELQILSNGDFTNWKSTTDANEWQENATITRVEAEHTSAPYAMQIDDVQTITEGDAIQEGGNTDPKDQVVSNVTQTVEDEVSSSNSDQVFFRAVPQVTTDLSPQEQRHYLVNVYAQIRLDSPNVDIAGLDAAISQGDEVTSLNVDSTSESLNKGETIFVVEGSNEQEFLVDSDTPSGSTTISVFGRQTEHSFSTAATVQNTTSNYLKEDGTWGTAQDRYVSWGYRGIPAGMTVPKTVVSDAVPTDGNITVILYEPVDRHVFTHSGGTFQTATGIIWDDAQIGVLPAGSGESEADTTVISLDSTENVESRENTTLVMGDGPSIHNPNALLYSGGLTQNWGRTAGHTNTDSIDEITAKTWLLAQSDFLETHEAGYFEIDLRPHDSLEVGGTPYAWQWFQSRYKKAEQHVEGVEVKLTSATVSSEITSDEGTGSFLGSGEGTIRQFGLTEEGSIDNSVQNALTTTRDVINSGNQTSIPINPIGEGVLEQGDKAFIIDRSRPRVIEVTLSADQGATDDTLSIESNFFDGPVPAPSGVYAGEADFKTARVQTENYLLSTARNSQIAELDEDVRGEVSTIKIRSMQSDIIIGEDLVVVNQETGERYEFTAAETQPTFHAGVTFSVEGDRDSGTARIIANEGDPIFKPKAWEQARQIIEPDQIRTDVRQERDLRSVGILSQDVNGTSITSLPMNSLEVGLDKDQTIEVIRVDYEQDADGIYVPDTNVFEATVSSDTAASPNSSTSIPINSTEVRANAFSPVFVRNGALNSQIIQNVDEIILRVKSSEQMSELTINLESITVDTNILRSDSWDGSVDSSGSVTASTSTAGWAITGAGEVDIKVAGGNVRVNENGGVELTAGSSTSSGNDPKYVSWDNGTGITGVSGGVESLYFRTASGVHPLQLTDAPEVKVLGSADLTMGSGQIIIGSGGVDGSSLPDIGNAGAGELGVDSNGFVKRA